MPFGGHLALPQNTPHELRPPRGRSATSWPWQPVSTPSRNPLLCGALSWRSSRVASTTLMIALMLTQDDSARMLSRKLSPLLHRHISFSLNVSTMVLILVASPEKPMLMHAQGLLPVLPHIHLIDLSWADSDPAEDHCRDVLPPVCHAPATAPCGSASQRFISSSSNPGLSCIGTPRNAGRTRCPPAPSVRTHSPIKTDIQTRETDKETDRQRDRQTDRETDSLPA